MNQLVITQQVKSWKLGLSHQEMSHHPQYQVMVSSQKIVRRRMMQHTNCFARVGGSSAFYCVFHLP